MGERTYLINFPLNVRARRTMIELLWSRPKKIGVRRFPDGVPLKGRGNLGLLMLSTCQKNVGNPPLSLPLVLADQTPTTAPKIRDCVTEKDYAHVCKLSKTCKYGLLANSAF